MHILCEASAIFLVLGEGKVSPEVFLKSIDLLLKSNIFVVKTQVKLFPGTSLTWADYFFNISRDDQTSE